MGMNAKLKRRIRPFLLILSGFLILVVTDLAIIAGACVLLGITMIINWIWPVMQKKQSKILRKGVQPPDSHKLNKVQ